jgi:alpha-L-fucosidase
MAGGADFSWWDDARYGLFVHWGVMSLPERGDWVMHREHIPVAEYERLGERFTAARWDPAAQAALARRAGMRYAVLVTRHHDGFCLWDTATTGFKATDTPAGRDLVAEWVDAFRAEGLRVGLYYSLLDWRVPAYWRGSHHDPDGWAAFREMVHAQVRELLTGYGAVSVLWYDGFWPWPGDAWGAAELAAMARDLQPGILINDRSGVPGDFSTPEQAISVLPPFGRWEACMTTAAYWGWHAGDHQWKTPAEIVRSLVACAAGGGNLLLNVGPDPEGAMPVPAAELLEAVGAWLAANGASIYGTIRSPLLATGFGAVTARPGHLYLHCLVWPADGEIRLGWVANRASAARLLAGDELAVRQDADVVTVSGLPKAAPDRLDTVIDIVLDGGPDAVPGGYVWWGEPAQY